MYFRFFRIVHEISLYVGDVVGLRAMVESKT